MGKNKSYSRREFLKASSLASTAVLFSGCSNFQSAFSGDKKNLSNEVVILGAGAAGLAAAYTLKKNKIPYRMFEASSRIGGRIYTLQDFTSSGLEAELGAEVFSESHRNIFQLCKELSLETRELKDDKKLEEALFFLNGKIWTLENYRKKLKPLYIELSKARQEIFSGNEVRLTVENIDQYEKALPYDSLSAAAFIHNLSLRMDAEPLDMFLIQIRNHFGVEPELLSALQLMCALGREPLLGLVAPKASYKIVGGCGTLTRTLYERVAGVIPDFMVKVNHALTSVRTSSEGFELEFKTGSGKQIYKTKQIICTLPFSTLRDVDGVRELNFSPAKKELIQSQAYTSLTKGVMEFTEPFWKKKTAEHPAYSGRLSGDFDSQNFCDSSWAQEGEGALLSTLRGGRSAAMLNTQIFTEGAQDLEKSIRVQAP